jgi:hypothetical protein
MKNHIHKPNGTIPHHVNEFAECPIRSKRLIIEHTYHFSTKIIKFVRDRLESNRFLEMIPDLFINLTDFVQFPTPFRIDDI